MTIPWISLLGGMLLGLSATLLLLFNGKIAGISGILAGIIKPVKRDLFWRIIFVLGMVTGGSIGMNWLGATIPEQYNISYPMLALAGLLVGLGTKIGNGCTSGHGICGMGRLSTRSIVATCVFMLVAIITVFIRLHIL